MAPTDQANEMAGWRGRNLVGSDGSKIGSITDIYLDEDTGQPEWLAVKTGMFGGRVSFVPLAGATAQGDERACRWTKDQVKDAPNAEADGRLSQDEEAALYRHYGMGYSETRSDSGLPEGGQAGGRPTTTETARETSGRSRDSAMTRSEEQLRVGKTSEEAGRVRLRKWVETEQIAQTVPVQREEVRVEREPITEANRDAALSGSEITESEHEVTLHEERAVAEKEVVPKERVRLDKDIVTEEQEVGGEIRKERVEVEGDQDAVPRDRRR